MAVLEIFVQEFAILVFLQALLKQNRTVIVSEVSLQTQDGSQLAAVLLAVGQVIDLSDNREGAVVSDGDGAGAQFNFLLSESLCIRSRVEGINMDVGAWIAGETHSD